MANIFNVIDFESVCDLLGEMVMASPWAKIF